MLSKHQVAKKSPSQHDSLPASLGFLSGVHSHLETASWSRWERYLISCVCVCFFFGSLDKAILFGGFIWLWYHFCSLFFLNMFLSCFFKDYSWFFCFPVFKVIYKQLRNCQPANVLLRPANLSESVAGPFVETDAFTTFLATLPLVQTTCLCWKLSVCQKLRNLEIYKRTRLIWL